MKNIILIIIIFISNNTIAQSKKLSRFYDFEVEIDFNHLLFKDDYKIIFSKKLKQNSLYKIKYKYDPHQNRIPIDTLRIDLSKDKMNKIFNLTVNQFSIEYKENLSEYKIPPPPPVYNGLVVSLILDLNYRGDFYQKKVSLPFSNKKFQELNSFVEDIFEKK